MTFCLISIGYISELQETVFIPQLWPQLKMGCSFSKDVSGQIASLSQSDKSLVQTFRKAYCKGVRTLLFFHCPSFWTPIHLSYVGAPTVFLDQVMAFRTYQMEKQTDRKSQGHNGHGAITYHEQPTSRLCYMRKRWISVLFKPLSIYCLVICGKAHPKA